MSAGRVVTLTATVRAGGTAITTGQVNFCDASVKYCTDVHLLGSSQLTADGTAVFRFAPAAGTHCYKAVFAGTNSAASSTSEAIPLLVNSTGKLATTSFAASGTPGNYALSATATGFVSPASAASLPGTVSFIGSSIADSALADVALGAPSTGMSWASRQAAVPGSPALLAIADFNGDGITDMAAITSASSIVILLGNGNGTFAAQPQKLKTGGYPAAIAAADFNGDGKIDLAVLDAGNGISDGAVTILLGNGDGTFTDSPETPSARVQPGTLVVADFNGDGIPDLAITDYGAYDGSGDLTVLLGNGDGTFTAAPPSPAIGGASMGLIAADFNGDGVLDLAFMVPHDGSGLIQVMLGNGDGTFAAPLNTYTDIDPSSIVIGDFNGDGKLDMAVATYPGLEILLGNGNGTFTTKSSGLDQGTVLALGDFNGDGNADLALLNGGNLTILLGNGDATFTATADAPPAGTNVFQPMVADFNGDGLPDIAIANGAAGSITVLLTELIQTAAATASNLPLTGPLADLVEANYAGDSNDAQSTSAAMTLPPAAATSTSLVIASGVKPVTTVAQGTVVTLMATVKSGAAAVTSGLVNFCYAAAKSCTDIHLLGSVNLSAKGTAQLKFIPGPGVHSYKAVCVGEDSHLASASVAHTLTVTPVAHGKIPTIAAITISGTTSDYKLTGTVTAKGFTDSLAGVLSFLDATDANTLLGKTALGPGINGIDFVKAANIPVGANPVQAAVADFNGDGIPDLAITNYEGFSVTVLLGKGDGTFAPAPASLSTAGPPFAIQVADFNGDGKPDLAVSISSNSNTFGSLQVFLGKGDGTFRAVPARALGGPFVIGDFNRDGIPDLAFANESGNAITVLSGKGDGTFRTVAIETTFASPYYLAQGDFNGDGKLDLAVLSGSTADAVTILLGNGDGTFTAVAKTAPTGRGPNAIAVADFNGDGKLDMAVVNSSAGTLSVLLGSGNGAFTALLPNLVAGNGADSIRVGDFNGDGIPDLAVASFNTKSVSVFLGKGAGAFAEPIGFTPSADPQSLAVADFNGDGMSDLGVVVVSSHVDVLLARRVQTSAASVGHIAPKGKGTHEVKVSYSGNANFAASVSISKPITGTASAPAPAEPAGP